MQNPSNFKINKKIPFEAFEKFEKIFLLNSSKRSNSLDGTVRRFRKMVLKHLTSRKNYCLLKMLPSHTPTPWPQPHKNVEN